MKDADEFVVVGFQAFPTNFEVLMNERNYSCEVEGTYPGCCKGIDGHRASCYVVLT